MKIVYVEYDVPAPNRMPWSAVPDKDGNFWMPYYGAANRIGKLDPKTGAVSEYRVPNQGTAAIHSAVPAPDGSVWLTEQGANKLGRWDPVTETIKEYQDSYLPGKEGVTAGGAEAHLARRRGRAEYGPRARLSPCSTRRRENSPDSTKCPARTAWRSTRTTISGSPNTKKTGKSDGWMQRL